MAIKALELIEAIRWRLNDEGGDTGTPSAGFYARWQEDDSGCLWKNRELVLYLNQTLRDLGGRAPLKDSAWREIQLCVNTRGSALDEDIIRVDSVTRTSDGQPLIKVTVAEMQMTTRWNRLQREMRTVDWRAETGWPTHYLTDEQQGQFTVYPTPDADHRDTIRLVVWMQYPVAPTWATLQAEATPRAELESVTDDLDEALIAGVCARAYRKHDADAYAPQLAKQFDAEFTALVGPSLSQRQLMAESRWADVPGDMTPRTYFAN
jgi:hypothetical protein